MKEQGKRQKAKGKRQKAKGKRQKAKGKTKPPGRSSGSAREAMMMGEWGGKGRLKVEG
jgi:hypothetical protein